MDNNIEKEIQIIVTELVDFWNVGIKSGYLTSYMCRDTETVKKHMRSVGIVVYLCYEKDLVKFIMTKASADTIPNPFDTLKN